MSTSPRRRSKRCPAWSPRLGRTPLASRLVPGEALVLMSNGIGDPLGTGADSVGRGLADALQTSPHEVDLVE